MVWLDGMIGKTVLVTGATSGIGLETAVELAHLGARVLVHGRSEATAARAAETIRARGGAEAEPVAADFTSLEQVRVLAEQVRDATDRLDVLVNNAGVYLHSRELTADGLETTLQVNYLAAFLLTDLLLGMMTASIPSRVVTVSSVAHFRGQLDFDDLGLGQGYDGYLAYANSKLMNVMFAFELASRMEGTGVTSNALHPGVIDTKLLQEGFGDRGASVETGAATPVYLASDHEVEDVTGRYFVNQHPAQASPAAMDREARARLWSISEKLTGMAAG